MTALPDSPVVLRDVFPAEVTVQPVDGPPAVLRGVRAVITADELFVFSTVNDAPAVVYRAAWVEDGTDLRRAWSSPPYVVQTTSDRVYVNRGAGCGCSSPLRRARLFTGAARGGAA